MFTGYLLEGKDSHLSRDLSTSGFRVKMFTYRSVGSVGKYFLRSHLVTATQFSALSNKQQ